MNELKSIMEKVSYQKGLREGSDKMVKKLESDIRILKGQVDKANQDKADLSSEVERLERYASGLETKLRLLRLARSRKKNQ